MINVIAIDREYGRAFDTPAMILPPCESLDFAQMK